MSPCVYLILAALKVASEHQDAFNQDYEDWECAELCESHRDVAIDGKASCCAWHKSGADRATCLLHSGGTVKNAWAGNDFRAYNCTRSTRGGGDCAMKFGKTCSGEGVAAIQMPETSPDDAPAAPHEWTLQWSEDFDACDLANSSSWSFEELQRKDRLQWYTTSNAACESGNLVITAKRETPMDAGYSPHKWRGTHNAATFQYTSSSLTSKGKLNFTMGGCGKVEMRGKIDIRNGAFPAWWAMADFDYDGGIPCSWPGCNEIDMMEYAGKHGWLKSNFCVGKGGDASGGVASGGACDWQNRITAVTDSWARDFHTWTMQWREDQDRIELLLDGSLYLTQTFSASDPEITGRSVNPWRGQPHYMIINLAIGPLSMGGDPSGTAFPMEYLVDYVRYWTCGDGTIKITNHSEPPEISGALTAFASLLPCGVRTLMSLGCVIVLGLFV